jgi:hypothetical protein
MAYATRIKCAAWSCHKPKLVGTKTAHKCDMFDHRFTLTTFNYSEKNGDLLAEESQHDAHDDEHETQTDQHSDHGRIGQRPDARIIRTCNNTTTIF